MRKVIVIDDTYLYGKYGGMLLCVVAQNTENHIYPFAFYDVYKENDDSWTSFFEKLKTIVDDDPYLCVISNKHISIANAFSRVYSHAHHGLCMRHLCENLRVNQYYEGYLALFYYAAKAYYLNEFSKIFTKFKDKCPKVAHIFENVVGFEKWSRAYFSGNRYNVMTTNIAKSVNSLLMKKRKYPMSYIFNSISKKFDEKFKERHAHVGNSNKKLGPYVKKILRDNKRENDFLYVTNANGDLD